MGSPKTNPAALAYLYPSIPLAVYSKLAASYYEDELVTFLHFFLEAGDLYAVARDLVPPLHRQQMADRAFKMGRKVYYLLRRGELAKRATLRAKDGSRVLEDWAEGAEG